MWRHWLIGRTLGEARTIYAPDLLTAFHLARTNGAGSADLTCFGSNI